MRDPRQLPEAGDRLEYRGWIVTVIGRAGSEVSYTRSLGGSPADGQRRQDLATWNAWAVDAKVLRAVPANGAGAVRSASPAGKGECTVMLFGIAGPCTACGRTLGHEVHIGEGLGVLHPQCCTARRHGKPRGKVAAA